MKIHLIAAARPNFMKIAPLYHALKREDWAQPVVVHTGQHYDLNMSAVFFQDLGLPEPDIHLGVGSGSHAEQTGQVMIAYEKILIDQKPDLVVVVGDVNSTVAATLAAVKLGIKVAHLEAGLRSFDRAMPEEINRIVTDSLADLLWTPSEDGDRNLKQEGVAEEKIARVGNIMIDSLEMLRDKINADNTCERLSLERGGFALATLHRPANVDHREPLTLLCENLASLSDELPLVFPIHPRTRKNIDAFGLGGVIEKKENLKLLGPLNYISFMNLVFNCRLAVTDSGGIQEETTYLGLPCLTLRPNTERPITIEKGTNQLCTIDNLENRFQEVLANPIVDRPEIDMWDGHTADRVVQSINILRVI